jgi:UDP-N-acetylglucosamine 3-dehydrogenase
MRLGLVGLGTMGRNHLRVISNHPETVLAAVSDVSTEALAAAVEQTGAQGFADPLEMIASAEIDGLVVASPTTSHAAQALAAIERGLPTLVEKPLAATIEDGLAIVTAARKRGVRVQVGHVERYNPAVLEMGRLLREGWLSNIYAITSRRAGPFPARIRDVGVTVDLGTHDVDMLCWIAGERPTRVYAETSQRIHATHFPSGATGFLDVDWLTPAKRRSLVAVGEEGMFELDYLTQKLTFTRSDVEQPQLIGGYATTFTGDVAEIPVVNVEPLRSQLDEFVRVLRTGERPYVDAEDGLWAVAIANALLTAAAEQRPVDLTDMASRLGAP